MWPDNERVMYEITTHVMWTTMILLETMVLECDSNYAFVSLWRASLAIISSWWRFCMENHFCSSCNHLIFSVLLVTYVTMLCLSTACYQWHISLCLVLFPCVICDIHVCCRSFISLNFADLQSIIAGISTEFSMMSHSENEAVNATKFNMFTGHFVSFEWWFCSKTDHCTGNLGVNMIKHLSEMELYNILLTLEKFECWNWTVLIMKFQPMKWCQLHGHPHSSYR